jgi:hypothetical protein
MTALEGEKRYLLPVNYDQKSYLSDS